MKRRNNIVMGVGILSAFALLFSSFIIYESNRRIPVEPITSSIQEHVGRINSVGCWDDLNNDNYTYSIISITPGEKLSFKCFGMVFFSFLSSYQNPQKGKTPDYCRTNPDYSGRFSFPRGVHSIVVPEGAHFLYLSRLLNGRDSTPRYLYIDYVNVLEGTYPDVPQALFEDYPFDKQQVCVHHDSFCREVSDKPWHIGSNGGQYLTMEYESPRADYGFVDDGFRILDGLLTNDESIKIKEAFRLINNSLIDEALIEIPVPKEPQVYERFVFNFKDYNNFDCVQIRKGRRHVIIESIIRKDGIETTHRLLKKCLTGNAIRLFTSKEGISIYCDNQELTKSELLFSPVLRCGLMIDNQHTYQYDFFNCFQLQPYKVYDESQFTDNGIKQTHSGLKQGWVQDYSYTLDSVRAQKSRYAERFELRRNTITDYTNDRVEKSFNYQLQTNLRKIHIEFDILIPEDFEIDETLDCLMQIHDRVDEASLEGRSPYFSIRLQNNLFMLTSMSIEKYAKSSFNVIKMIPLAECELGKWNHFSIYLKEGYLAEHNPQTKIILNNIVVYESSDPNTNNNPRGGYIRYGIYKSSWLKGKGSIMNKVIYFDNFIVQM